MMSLLLIVLSALQQAICADLSRYPLMAPATLQQGPGLLPLPPELVGAWGDDLDRSLLLLGPDGEPVPYVVLRNQGWEEEDRRFSTLRPVSGAPGAIEWETKPFDTPVGGLRLMARGEAFVARAWTARQAGGAWVWQEAGLIWRTPGGEWLDVPISGGFGPYRVRIQPLSGEPPALTGAEGYRIRAAGTEMLVEEIEVGQPAPGEAGEGDGFAVYRVDLPGPREIRTVELIIEGDDIFSRTVRIYDEDGSQVRDASVERVQVGDVHVERTRIRNMRLQGRSFTFAVQTERGVPLSIPRVRLQSTGVVLLAERPVATIYAGNPQPDEAYDLKIAAQELLRGTAALGRVGASVPNPAWVPPPTREGVDGPGAVLTPILQRWQRRILGGPGWVRVPLGPEVLAHASPGLSELRVVDKDGREIPHLRKGRGMGAPEEAQFTQAEAGDQSQIRIQNRLPLSTVGQLTIEVEPATFRRTLALLQDRGLTTETLRSRMWNSEVHGHTLTLDLNTAPGAELLLRIENGGNPPLKIRRITLTRPAAELYARLPEGGARLLYGSERGYDPSYDLDLLRAEVMRMPVADASLGPEEPVTAAQNSGVDQAAAAVALGILAVGLVGTTLWLIRSAADREAEGKGPDGQGKDGQGKAGEGGTG